MSLNTTKNSFKIDLSIKTTFLVASTVEPQLSEHHGRHTIRSDNRGVRIDEGNRNLLSVGYRVGDN